MGRELQAKRLPAIGEGIARFVYASAWCQAENLALNRDVVDSRAQEVQNALPRVLALTGELALACH